MGGPPGSEIGVGVVLAPVPVRKPETETENEVKSGNFSFSVSVSGSRCVYPKHEQTHPPDFAIVLSQSHPGSHIQYDGFLV